MCVHVNVCMCVHVHACMCVMYVCVCVCKRGHMGGGREGGG